MTQGSRNYKKICKEKHELCPQLQEKFFTKIPNLSRTTILDTQANDKGRRRKKKIKKKEKERSIELKPFISAERSYCTSYLALCFRILSFKGKKSSDHALIGLLFQFSDKQPIQFNMEVMPGTASPCQVNLTKRFREKVRSCKKKYFGLK